jgi:hypothetical protein
MAWSTIQASSANGSSAHWGLPWPSFLPLQQHSIGSITASQCFMTSSFLSTSYWASSRPGPQCDGDDCVGPMNEDMGTDATSTDEREDGYADPKTTQYSLPVTCS